MTAPAPFTFRKSRGLLQTYGTEDTATNGPTVGVMIVDHDGAAAATTAMQWVSELSAFEVADTRGTQDVVYVQDGESGVLRQDPEADTPYEADTTDATPAGVVLFDIAGADDTAHRLIAFLPVEEGDGFAGWTIDEPEAGLARVRTPIDGDDTGGSGAIDAKPVAISASGPQDFSAVTEAGVTLNVAGTDPVTVQVTALPDPAERSTFVIAGAATDTDAAIIDLSFDTGDVTVLGKDLLPAGPFVQPVWLFTAVDVGTAEAPAKGWAVALIAGQGDWINVGDGGAPAFQNSWVWIDTLVGSPTGYAQPRFTRGNGIGHVQATAVGGGSAASTIFTLPAGYRPTYNLQFMCLILSLLDGSNGIAAVQIGSNGDVSVQWAFLYTTTPTVAVPADGSFAVGLSLDFPLT